MTLQLARWPQSPGSSNLILCGNWLGTGAWLAHASLWEQDVCDAIVAGDSRTIRQMIEERAQFEEEDYPLYVAVVAPDMFARLFDNRLYPTREDAERARPLRRLCPACHGRRYDIFLSMTACRMCEGTGWVA